MCYDDQASYWDAGYPAVILMDCYEAHMGAGETVPHYHRTTDTIGTLDLDRTTEAVRATVAAMAVLAVPWCRHHAPRREGPGPRRDAPVVDRRRAQLGRRCLPRQGVRRGRHASHAPAGLTDTWWPHAGTLGDGVLRYYRVTRH